MKIRLQKWLAEAGVGSRRKCEEIIRAGRVTVSGEVAVLGSSVDPDADTVELDGHPLSLQSKEYWLLNKPAGVLSAVSDARGRPTVVDYVSAAVRVFPVGRLDINTTGLLLLTNDGALSSRLLHPRYHVDKEYLVELRGALSAEALEDLRAGVMLEDGPTSPARVKVIGAGPSSEGDTTRLLITIHEGRKRQVRRMLEAVGQKVFSLHRTSFAGLTDSQLPVGQARRLTVAEVDSLWRQAEKT